MRWALGLAALVACTPPADDPSPRADADTAGTPEPVDGACGHAHVIDWLAEIPGAPLADGDPVELIHGPQSGWHVAVAAGVRGPRDLWVHPVVTRADTGEQLAGANNTNTGILWDWDPTTCEGLLYGLRARFDDAGRMTRDRICALAGVPLDLTLEVGDLASDTTTSATVRVVAVPDPDDDCP